MLKSSFVLDSLWIPCNLFKYALRGDSPCLRGRFNDTLLVITFNFPLYESLPLLYSMYRSAFPNIYVCGPKTNKTTTRTAIENSVNFLDIHKGYYAYDCVSEAILRHQNYSGYLFLMDDVLLNFWTLQGFSFNRLWEGPKQPIAVGKFSPPSQWYWWQSRWGRNNCQKAYNEVHHMKKDSPETSIIASEMLSKLRRNGNGVSRCFRGRSDIFYVPRKFAKRFSMLSSIFRKHEVFLEIAVPTIFRMLDRAENFEILHGHYLPGRVGEEPVTDGRYFWTLYDEDLNFQHPLKLHYGTNSTMNFAILQNWFLVKVSEITNCRSSEIG